MIELNTAFEMIVKGLTDVNTKNGFTLVRPKGVKSTESPVFTEEEQQYIQFTGSKGAYIVSFDPKNSRMALKGSEDEQTGEAGEPEYKQLSLSLFEPEEADDRDVKSLINELADTVQSRFGKVAKKASDVKMPKSVSKTKAKNGTMSYGPESLGARFCTQYPELKEQMKENIAAYGEFLPETFFLDVGDPYILAILRSGDQQRIGKLFKLLNEIYEDGTNEVQDIIAVTVLGEVLCQDKELLEIAQLHMSDYLGPVVHAVCRTLRSTSLQKKLKNPPPYKPKKEKKSMMSSLMNQQPPQ